GIPQRKERERLRRKKEILEAAKKIFSKKGFMNTTIEEVAKESELSTGTIYLYFTSKEELYVSLIVESYDILIEDLQKAMTQDVAPDELLISMANTYYKFCTDHPDHYRIINFIVNEHLNLRLTPELTGKIGDKTDTIFRMVSEVVKLGIKRGVFKQIDTWDVTSLFWSSLHGIIQVQTSIDYLKGRTTDIGSLVRKNMEFMVSAIRVDSVPL
ncbi:MAG: TetR/AcrR family transcriptional regulator, partial [Thermodesulfobacteriota bacterium]|nr:TetR/AcrR family transcriptional regulator [Thermodesulfobacteriota bacterium]